MSSVCIVFTYHKTNDNRLSNTYTFFHSVGFKKFLMTCAVVELDCVLLEGATRSIIDKN